MFDYGNRHKVRLADGIKRLTREQFISVCVDDWDDANHFDSCECTPAVQCDFCNFGYNLEVGNFVAKCLIEYDAALKERTQPSTTPEQDYDRAMRCVQ